MYYIKKIMMILSLYFLLSNAFFNNMECFALEETEIHIEANNQETIEILKPTTINIKTNIDNNHYITIKIQSTNDTVKEICLPINKEESPLLEIEDIDNTYTGQVIKLDTKNRDLLERLVMGEAGTEGYVGAALVAQTLHDTMIHEENYSVLEIKEKYAYAGSLESEPNQDVKDAVSFIFDKGNIAIKHELRYFYAPKHVESSFHENQEFIIEYEGHRFFMEKSIEE